MDDKFYIEAYVRYREKIKDTDFCAKPVPYKWFTLPAKVSQEWFIYCEMLKDLSRQLANDINQLWRYIVSLEAWSKILITSNYDEKEELYLLLEFIEPLAIVALDLPNAIRARFIYSLSHVCHQANRIKNLSWVDDLPNDKSINFKTMDKKCASWKGYSDFKLQFSKIADESFNSSTSEFRHRFHHRVPVSVEIGITSLVSRQKVEDKHVTYGIGGSQPIRLNNLVDILKNQYMKITRYFKAYQNLVHEQLNEIFST